jgi:hypothetical protein
MGHSALATTSIYLHARSVTEQAQVFTRAFESRPQAVADLHVSDTEMARP